MVGCSEVGISQRAQSVLAHDADRANDKADGGVARRYVRGGLPTIATARWSHLGELGANTGTGGTFGRLPNDPTIQEVDWHRKWKGQFGMPTTKVKKKKSK